MPGRNVPPSSSAAAEPAFAMITVETLPIVDKHSLRVLFYLLLLASVQWMLMRKLEAPRELAVQDGDSAGGLNAWVPSRLPGDSAGW